MSSFEINSNKTSELIQQRELDREFELLMLESSSLGMISFDIECYKGKDAVVINGYPSLRFNPLKTISINPALISSHVTLEGREHINRIQQGILTHKDLSLLSTELLKQLCKLKFLVCPSTRKELIQKLISK